MQHVSKSAETHKADGAGRVGWNQAGSAADRQWVEAGSRYVPTVHFIHE